MRLQNEVISLKLKLNEAEMERLRAEKEKQKILEKFIGVQKENAKLEYQLSQKHVMFKGDITNIQEVLVSPS